jgi:hypothetical protein
MENVKKPVGFIRKFLIANQRKIAEIFQIPLGLHEEQK